MTSAISLVLTLGQCLRLRELLWPIDSQTLNVMIELLWGGLLILCEVATPLACALSVLFLSFKARREGMTQLLGTLGVSPLRVLPLLLIFAALGASISYSAAHYTTPLILSRLGKKVSLIGERKWRQALPHLLAEHLSSEISSERSAVFQPTSSWIVTLDTSSPSEETGRHAEKVCYFGADFINELSLIACWFSHDQGDLVTFHDVQLSSNELKLSFNKVELPLFGVGMKRASSTFGPPNTLLDHELDKTSVHHRFIFHKRSANPLLIFPLVLLAFSWGIRLSSRGSVSLLLLTALIAHGGQRQLELLCRSGALPPSLAAWFFTILLSLITLIDLRYWPLRSWYDRPPKSKIVTRLVRIFEKIRPT